VDGKAVAQRSKRALALITRARTGAALSEELRLINRLRQDSIAPSDRSPALVLSGLRGDRREAGSGRID